MMVRATVVVGIACTTVASTGSMSLRWTIPGPAFRLRFSGTTSSIAPSVVPGSPQLATAARCDARVGGPHERHATIRRVRQASGVPTSWKTPGATRNHLPMSTRCRSALLVHPMSRNCVREKTPCCAAASLATLRSSGSLCHPACSGTRICIENQTARRVQGRDDAIATFAARSCARSVRRAQRLRRARCLPVCSTVRRHPRVVRSASSGAMRRRRRGARAPSRNP